MLSNARKKILLMNPVRIDYNLSKHKKPTGLYPNQVTGVSEIHMDSGAFDNAPMAMGAPSAWGVRGGADSEGGIDNPNIWDGVPFEVQRRFRSKTKRRLVELYIKFRLLFEKPTKDPVEIFTEVKDNFQSLENSDMDLGKMVELLKSLERAKQVAAGRTVKAKKDVLEVEAKLFASGIVQYQTEDSLIKFILQCKKGLCLSEIDNFERVIPADVIDKIEEAEALKLFDNYYILHYDPTEAKNIYFVADEKPKDPIVFGVIRNSNKLYYIADWIDKYCNLTYKDILDKGNITNVLDFQEKLKEKL